ncbi:hypothetical protein M9H77_02540 [Catharanthus roseus]|uniref:Uncharacterized protein n=1 Tax=Catharanthus roseus TaxID=4058 RepID=A0ACC0C965_CATRO|nr:hypothetical protein M9H77_02540 [Catharanthus roseus]
MLSVDFYHVCFNGMTRDAQKTVDLFQGPITRTRTERMEDEHKGMAALFDKMLQNITWHKLEERRRLWRIQNLPIVQGANRGIQRSKLGRLCGFKIKRGIFFGPYLGGSRRRSCSTYEERIVTQPIVDGKSTLPSPIPFDGKLDILRNLKREELRKNPLIAFEKRQVPFVPSILKMSLEEEQNRNHNEGPSDLLM